LDNKNNKTFNTW